MLQENTTYRTAAIFDQDPGQSVAGAYDVLRMIGSGVVARVYRVADPQSGSRIAAKVPIGPEDGARIESEYNILKAMGAYFRQIMPERVPVPLAYGLVTLEPEYGGSPVGPVMLMEYIGNEVPEMYTAYRARAARGTARARMEAEFFAWECALRYLDVLAFTIGRLGITTGDRKRDTFRWDEHGRRLIVMDWNMTEQVRTGSEAQVEANALTSLAQNWYTMLTGRQASFNLPDMLEDTPWNNLSLFGRGFIADLQAKRPQTPGFDKTLRLARQRLMREFVDPVSDPKLLGQQLRQVGQEWRELAAEKDSAVRPYQMRRILITADLARRALPDEQARKEAETLYTAVRAGIQQGGDEVPANVPVEAVLNDLDKYIGKTAPPTERFRRLVQDALTLLRDDRRRAQGYSFNLYAMVEELRELEHDIAGADVKVYALQEQLRRLEQQYRNATGEKDIDAVLPELRRQIDFYIMLVEMHRNLLLGEMTAARNRFETLDAWAQDPNFGPLCYDLGINPDELFDLFARIKSSVAQQRGVYLPVSGQTWPERFREACQAATDSGDLAPLDDLIKAIITARASQMATRGDQDILAFYQHCLTVMKGAYHEYLDDVARQKVFDELLEVLHNLPQGDREVFRNWLLQTPLMHDLQARYEAVRAAYFDDPAVRYVRIPDRELRLARQLLLVQRAL